MSDETKNDDDLLKSKEVADLWRIKVTTLRNWVCDPNHTAPKGFKIGNSRVWRRKVVNDYVSEMESAA